MLTGGTGTGKSRLAASIARPGIRRGKHGFGISHKPMAPDASIFNVVDLWTGSTLKPARTGTTLPSQAEGQTNRPFSSHFMNFHWSANDPSDNGDASPPGHPTRWP